MKNKVFNIVIATMVAFIALSFTAANENRKEVKKSKVVWKGYYQFLGAEKGTIELKSGFLTFEADKLTGGKFTIDMPTLISLDQQGEYKEILEKHLKSDDFFGVITYPTATMEFKKVKSISKNSYTVTGDLTIKGITKPIVFDVAIYGSKASASLKIDRAIYNVKHGSTSFFDNLKDKAIFDEFDLVVDLEF